MRARRIISVALPLAGAVALAAFLAWKIDFRRAWEAVRGADRSWLACACGASVLLTGGSAVRVWWLLRWAGHPRPMARCWSANMAALTLNAVLPGRGGDLVKAVFLTHGRSEVRPLLGVMLVERGIDVLALALIACGAALVRGLWPALAVAGGIVLAAVGGLVVLCLAHTRIRLPKLGQGMTEGAHRILTNPVATAGALGLALCYWGVNVLVFVFLLRAVGAEAPASAVATAAPLAVLTGALPISISGIGSRDAMLVWLLSGTVAQPVALAASFLYLVIGYWMLALLGLVSLGRHTLAGVRRAAATVSARAPAEG
jgi:uncharacterized membrane protein YbhN (UPF0104 family)